MEDNLIKINLHNHSTASDGELTPEQLAGLLSEAGVTCAALTDHDTVSGSQVFRKTLARYGIACIDGAEITAASSGGIVHLLAYGIDVGHAALKELFGGGASSATKEVPKADRVIAAIHAAGGAAFLAHPLQTVADMNDLDTLLAELKAQGLDGLETIYAAYSQVETARLIDLADNRGLVSCAGGDFHAPGIPGQSLIVYISENRWIAFRDCLLARSLTEKPWLNASDPVPLKSRRPSTQATSRILLPAITAVMLFIVSLFLIIIPRVEAMMLDRKKETIRELTDSAISILDEYRRKIEDGSMTEAKAKSEAAERIRDLRYGPDNKDYFWITDMYPHMIMHPYRPDLEGTDVTNFYDENGLPVFVEFVRAVRDKDEGYVEYLWQWKDDANRIVPKLSFVRHYLPWDWEIGTGIYLEDVKAEIERLTANLIVLCIAITCILSLIVFAITRQSLRIEKEKNEAEEALRESRERYRALANGSTDGTIIVRNVFCAFANEAFLRMSGYAEKEIQLLRYFELFQDYPFRDDPLERLLDPARTRTDTDGMAVPCRLIRRSGETLDVFVSVTPMIQGIHTGAVLSVKPAVYAEPQAGAEFDKEPADPSGPIDALETDALWLAETAINLSIEIPTAAPDLPITGGAELMAAYGTDCLLVASASGEWIGIVTAGDLVRRGLANGVSTDSPIACVMTAPVVRAPASASVAECLRLFESSAIDRIILADSNGLPRMIQASSLIALLPRSFATLGLEAGRAPSLTALADLASRSSGLLEGIVRTGLRPRAILPLLSGWEDSLIQRLSSLAIAKLGQPPAPWAFVSLGSLGRHEFLPGSDQDNALIWEPSGDDREAERSYFADFGTLVCDGLEKTGMPRCPGGVMASNPLWNAPLGEWIARLEHSIAEPEADKLLDLQILLDFRRSAGSEEIAHRLRASSMEILRNRPEFFLHLAGDLRNRKIGGNPARPGNAVNLKELTAVFSGFTRLYALRDSIEATGTFERLEALTARGTLKTESRDRISDAFETILSLRLNRNPILAGRPFSAKEEGLVKFVLDQAILLQKRIGFDFLGSGL